MQASKHLQDRTNCLLSVPATAILEIRTYIRSFLLFVTFGHVIVIYNDKEICHPSFSEFSLICYHFLSSSSQVIQKAEDVPILNGVVTFILIT